MNSITEKLVSTLGFMASTPRRPVFPGHPLFETGKVVHLEGVTFLSFFELINLFVIFDELQAVHGKGYIYFDSFDSSGSNYKINDVERLGEFSEYYEHVVALEDFLSFCKYYGLFDALEKQSSAGRLFFPGVKDVLEGLKRYSGVRTSDKSRVLAVRPIESIDDANSFLKRDFVNGFIRSLQKRGYDSPLLSDGEFFHFFGYQLVKNIIDHASKNSSGWKGDHGSLGAIGMRLIERNKTYLLENDFKEGIVRRLSSKNEPVIEICVVDRGGGIYTSLKSSYEDILKRNGHNFQELQVLDVIAHAFDGLGSSKGVDEIVGGIHGLNRILRSIGKYGGVLKVRSDGIEIVYDGTQEKFLSKGDHNIGVYPNRNNISQCPHVHGVQYQILIPLKFPDEKSLSIFNYEEYYERNQDLKIKMIPVASYFEGCDITNNKTELQKCLSHIGLELRYEPDNILLVYDFSDVTSIDEDDFMLFLRSQKNIFASKRSAVAGVEKWLIKAVLDKETNDVEIHNRDDKNSVFFDILPSYKTAPVIEKRSNYAHWLGLGKYERAHTHIKKCIKTGKNIKVPSNRNDYDVSLYKNILNNNSRWFEPVGKNEFRPILNNALIQRIEESSISKAIEQAIEKYNCIRTGRTYQSPSRGSLTKAFFQSTPILQNENAAKQIGIYLSNCVRDFIGQDDKVTLVCTTAPSELLARSIVNELHGVSATIINLGHYSSLDEESVFFNSEWPAPAVYITDILDTQITTRRISKLLIDKGFKLRGIVAFCQIIQAAQSAPYPTVKLKKNKLSFGNNLINIYTLSELELDSSTQQDRHDENTIFVEPFSLELYPYEFWSKAGNFKQDQENQFKLFELDRIGAIKTGHWVYGNHHFRVVTDLCKIFSDYEMAGKISKEVTDLMNKNSVDCVVSPLHSHIGDILPLIVSNYMLTSNKSVSTYYCISTKVLKKKTFYVLPTELKELIKEKAKEASLNQSKQINIMFLDDAIASGRTVETFIRAIILELRLLYNSNNIFPPISPINSLTVYSVVSRQGLAKSTLMGGTQRVTVNFSKQWPTSDRSNIYDYGFDFEFSHWVQLDLPVDNRLSCGQCKDIEIIKSMRSLIPLPEKHSVFHILQNEADRKCPKSIESPEFYEMGKRELPTDFNIGRFYDDYSTKSYDLVLSEFYTQLYRGYPYKLLFEQFVSRLLLEKVIDIELEEYLNLSDLQNEIIIAIFSDWSRLHSQFIHETFIKICREVIESNAIAAKQILREAGKVLAHLKSDLDFIDRKMEISQRELILGLFKHALNEILRLSPYSCEKDLKNYKLDTYIRALVDGCVFFILNHRYYSSNKDVPSELSSLISESLSKTNNNDLAAFYLKEILSFIKTSEVRNRFIPALFTVLENTVRYYRHNHSHLLPKQFLKFLEIDYDTYPTSILKTLKSLTLEFSDSLKVIQDQSRILFSSSKVRNEISVLNEYVNNVATLIDQFSLNKDRVLFDRLKEQAGVIIGIFPNQSTSSILNELLETQINICTLRDFINDTVKSKNISFEEDVYQSRSYDKQETVIIPSFHSIQGFIENITIEAAVTAHEPPKVIFVVEEYSKPLNNYDRTRISIKTNFTSSNNRTIELLRKGSGMKQIYGFNFDLFDVYGNVVDTGDGFTTITLEFYSGFKKTINEV